MEESPLPWGAPSAPGPVGPLWYPVCGFALASSWQLWPDGWVSPLQDLVSCLSCLEGVFSTPSAGEGGSAPAQHGPLHCSALQSWSLLLTICPPSHIKSVLDK